MQGKRAPARQCLLFQWAAHEFNQASPCPHQSPKVKPHSLPSSAQGTLFAPHSPPTKAACSEGLPSNCFSRQCSIMGAPVWVPLEAQIWAQDHAGGLQTPSCQPQRRRTWEISNENLVYICAISPSNLFELLSTTVVIACVCKREIKSLSHRSGFEFPACVWRE